MFFPRCNDIHMWFMRFPIDVVFLRKNESFSNEGKYLVSSVHENVKPWRLLPLMDWRGSEALELPIGTIAKHAIQAGDEICIS